MAVLIRGKFPGKRKRVIENGSDVYIYQDLELVNKNKQMSNNPKLPHMPSDTLTTTNMVSKTYDTIYPSSPHAVIVTQPNINTIVCSPPVNSIFSYPCVAVQVMPPINSSQYENYNPQNVKQNVNLASNPVNVAQPLNLNHGISYILPNSTSAPVQPLQFAHIQGQPINQPTIQTMRLPLGNEQSTLHTPIPAQRLPVPQNLNSFQAPFSSHKGSPLQGQGSVPIKKKKANISPLKVQHISPKVQQKATPTLKKQDPNYGMPLNMTMSAPEIYPSYVMTTSKPKPASGEGLSPKVTSSNISPLMKVIKDEPKVDGSTLYSGQITDKNSLFSDDTKTVPRFDAEKVHKMMDSILPDMDVDDFISNEISEPSKVHSNSNLPHKKSPDTKASHVSPTATTDYYYNKHRHVYGDWKEKRKDAEEVSSSGTAVKKHPQNMTHKPEVITVTDNTVTGEPYGNQKSSQSQSPVKQGKSEKARKTWDEDLRKTLSEEGSYQNQSGKYKKSVKYHRRALFADFKEPVMPRPSFPNNFLKDPTAHSSIQRDRPEIRKSESSTSARVSYPCRVRDMHIKNVGEIGTMHTGISGVSNMQPYPHPGGSLQQLQMMPSKINIGPTSPTSSSGVLYVNHASVRPECGPLLYEQNQQQAVSTVLQTVKYLLRDIGHSWSETDIAKRLEIALYEENPAVLYLPGKPLPQYSSETSQEAFPCYGTPSLKELARSPFDYIDPLLHHQQTCQGLGCSEKCRTLRAAYTHLYVFRHRCQVWYTFARIFIKHSRVCRVARCTLPLCLFMKHELHLNGISVLPMHFKEEQHVLEDLFRRCEKVGQHNAELLCRHLQGIDNMGLGDPSMMISMAGNLRRSEANNYGHEIRMLLEEVHQKNLSQAVSRMLQVIIDMLRLHV